jgi:hypothetical protein
MADRLIWLKFLRRRIRFLRRIFTVISQFRSQSLGLSPIALSLGSALATAIGAVLDLIPAILPLLAPLKGTLANQTGFLGQIRFCKRHFLWFFHHRYLPKILGIIPIRRSLRPDRQYQNLIDPIAIHIHHLKAHLIPLKVVRRARNTA